MPKKLPLQFRCYAKLDKSSGQWSVVCIDLSLAAQADSYQKEKIKLHAMMAEYLEDAFVGQDRKHASMLLSRKAPVGQILYYYFLRIKTRFLGRQSLASRPFRDHVSPTAFA